MDLPPELYVVPEDLTYLTYAFLHADIFHLGGNMLFLWVFGDNIEDALGHFRFLVFYLLCAIGGAAFHGFLDPASEMPLIGASGAIAGIVSAYLVLHPRVKIWILAFGRIPLRIPAWIALTLWIGFQVLMFAARRRGAGVVGLPYRRHHHRRDTGSAAEAARRAAFRPRGRDPARRRGGADERCPPGRGQACAALGQAVISNDLNASAGIDEPWHAN